MANTETNRKPAHTVANDKQDGPAKKGFWNRVATRLSQMTFI